MNQASLIAERKIRFVAFYLPQFHSIPENDKCWGEGFTEWTNVRKAEPLFRGHYQPHVPTHLGYYNLMDSETRLKQADLARTYGIHGFCYWHYWFGEGKRLLEKPAQQVLKSGEPKFPFCFAWANQSWTGKWHGLNNKTIMRQSYPGIKDDVKHFYEVLPYFQDNRYIRQDNKQLFCLYRPFDHPHLQKFIDTWQDLAVKEGLNGIYFVGLVHGRLNDCKELDAVIIQDSYHRSSLSYFDKLTMKIIGKYPDEILSGFRYNCHRLSYKRMIEWTSNFDLKPNQLPNILAGWDNTPRCGSQGMVFYDFNPELFGRHVRKVLNQVKERNETLCVIKSWNEWAEGNYLEPERRFGLGLLEEFKNAVAESGVTVS